MNMYLVSRLEFELATMQDHQLLNGIKIKKVLHLRKFSLQQILAWGKTKFYILCLVASNVFH